MAAIMALVCVMLVAGCSKEEAEQEGAEMQQTETAGTAVTVNGETISDEDIAMEVSRLMQMRSRGINPQDLESARRGMRKEASTNVVNRMLLKQEVHRQKIEIPEEQVTERFTMIKEDFGSEEVFKARIERMNMTEDDLRHEVELGLAMEQLIEIQTAQLGDPSDQEIEAYYNEHIDRYSEPDKIRASHILIKVNPADDDQVRTEKRAQAEEILGKAKEGANFAQLAVEHSECPSKERGGDLDFFSRGMMVKEFENAVFALDVGGLSDIVETQFGYHIIKMTDRKEARVVPFAEVQQRVAADFGNERRQRTINDYLDNLRAAAKIEFLDSTLVE